MRSRTEERTFQITKLNTDLAKLVSISKNDERLIKTLKSKIHDYPIKRYEYANIDLDVWDGPICLGQTEYYAAYLYVKEHKIEVDKEIVRKKKQLAAVIKWR